MKKRRAQILDAVRHLFTKKGFAVTTIQDICEESGVNPGSLYDYVQNKDDILRLLFKEMMGDSAGGPDTFFPAGEINDLEGLSQYLRDLVSNSWNYRPDTISLAYQETRLLDTQTKREVMASDRDLIQSMANRIKRALGREVDAERLLVFLLAFKPLKGWTTKGLAPDMVAGTMVDMALGAL